MHTKDAVGAIYRLLEFGVPFQEMAQTLVAVTAQRLVQLKCPFCEGECSPFCRQYRPIRRAGVYELLYGRELAKAMRAAKGEEATYVYTRLKDVIKKGIALGFLHESVMESWLLDEAAL